MALRNTFQLFLHQSASDCMQTCVVELSRGSKRDGKDSSMCKNIILYMNESDKQLL